MLDNDENGLVSTKLAFDLASVTPPLALVELVRHIARISAENDYKTFLKTVETRYSGPAQKGPPP